MHVNHLPYLPFPPTFPTYIPKDKLANWFESYVESLELNFWTGTELTSGSYDEAKKQWRITLRKSDGSERTMRPRHLVFATGVSSIPTLMVFKNGEVVERFVGVQPKSRLQQALDSAQA